MGEEKSAVVSRQSSGVSRQSSVVSRQSSGVRSQESVGREGIKTAVKKNGEGINFPAILELCRECAPSGQGEY